MAGRGGKAMGESMCKGAKVQKCKGGERGRDRGRGRGRKYNEAKGDRKPGRMLRCHIASGDG